MKKFRITALLLCIIFLFSFSITGFGSANEPALKVDKVSVTGGGSVSVPIRLTENTGICGATLSISYDSRLTLTNIEKGTALASLTMTKPGDFSANPVNIVWDGMEADMTNGVIAILTFTAPNANGIYDISVSYEDGDILDGNIQPVNVQTIAGAIKVGVNKSVTIEIAGKSATLVNGTNTDGQVIAALYDRLGKLISLNYYNSSDENIKIDNVDSKVTSAKIMWWSNLSYLKPLCAAQTVDLTK